MGIKNRGISVSFVLLIVLLLLLSTLIVLAIFANNQKIYYGTVQGQVKIGPLCPVEPCNKTQNLTGYGLAFTDNGVDYYDAPLSASGNFSIRLRVGTYTVTMKPSCQWMGCSQVFPKKVTILTDQTTILNNSIDTGKR